MWACPSGGKSSRAPFPPLAPAPTALPPPHTAAASGTAGDGRAGGGGVAIERGFDGRAVFLQRRGGAGGGVVDVIVECQGSGGVHGYEALVFSLVVNDDPAADGEEPGGEALEFACRRGFEVAEKGVLHGIARGLQVTGVMAGEGEQRALVAVEKV